MNIEDEEIPDEIDLSRAIRGLHHVPEDSQVIVRGPIERRLEVQMGAKDRLGLVAALQETVGRQLSSVEFVQDYVQFHFDGPDLTAYTLPGIDIESLTIQSGDPGWRNTLCGRIGSAVIQADDADRRVSIRFEDGAVIWISLRDGDYRGPEALQLRLDNGRVWIA